MSGFSGVGSMTSITAWHTDRALRLGEREALRRVLVAHERLGDGLLQLAAQLGAVDRDVGDAGLAHPEHHQLQGIAGVVEVHDGLVGAGDRLVCA